MAKKTFVDKDHLNTQLSGKADTNHGNHVPATQTASNKTFLRNDNTWQTVTPANIGAAPTSHASTGTSYGVSSASNYGHAMASGTTPKANGTAAVGSETAKFARGDHVHPLQTTVSGNAGSATKLATTRAITIGNKSNNFDGTAAITYTLADIGAVSQADFNAFNIGGRNYITDSKKETSTTSTYQTRTLSADAKTDLAGKVVTASFDLKGTTAGGDIYVYFRSSSGSISPVSQTIGACTTSYKRYTITFTAPSDLSTAETFGFHTTSAVGTAYIKNVKLELGNRASSWCYAIEDYALASHGTHVTWATSAPKANGTAAVGSVARVAREDHVHPLQTSVSGNAGTATKATQDSAGQQINTTYIKGLSVSGKTITYTKGDGTTGTITTQDTNTTYSAATQSAAGLMSAADKTKLDGIATGANNYTHPSYTAKSSGFYKVTVDASGHVSATTAVAKADITGLGIPAQDTTYSAATQSAAGLMSAADKKKLDGVATSANNYSHPNSGVTASSYGPSANASPAHSGTFSVPYITVNAAGHITAASTKTITLPADNNTWRGIQNNLTSDSTSDSLSAAQGKALKSLIDGKANSSHTHTVLSVKSDNWKDSAALPSTYDRGETLFFSNNPSSNTFNGLIYGMVQTFKEYENGPAAWQFLYPYNAANDKFYVRNAQYNTDSWRSWAEVYTSLNKPTPAGIGAAPTSHASTATTYGVSSASNYGHAMASGTTPKANGTAAVGSETAKFARGDHVHPLQTTVSGSSGSCTGNAATATKFASAQSVALTGDVTGSASSQAGWSVATTLANSGVTAGNYGPSANATPAHGGTFSVPYVTVDAKGRVIAASTKTITLPSDNNTDTKVTYTLGTTTKYYMGGPTATTTGTGGITFDTGIYATTTAGQLSVGSLQTRGDITTSGNGNHSIGSTSNRFNSIYGANIYTYDANAKHYASLRTTTVGTTSTQGVGRLIAGNDTNAGTAGNAKGQILLYGTNTGYTTITPGYNSTSNITLTLPSSGGTLELTGHTHNYAGSSSAGGAANSVKTNLAIELNGGTTEGTNLFTFNGSTAKTVNITPSAIGAAPTSHASTATTYGAASASNYGHAMASSTTPKENGTAAVGSETAKFARGDHVHPLQTTVSGNAGSATKVNNNLVVKLNSGTTEGTNLFTFNGSAAKTINITPSAIGAAASSHTHSYAASESAGGGASGVKVSNDTTNKLYLTGVTATTANSGTIRTSHPYMAGGTITSRKMCVEHAAGYSPRASMGTWTDKNIGYVSVSSENSEVTSPGVGCFYMSPHIYNDAYAGYRLTMTFLNADNEDDPYTTDLLYNSDGTMAINSDSQTFSGVDNKYLMTINGGLAVQALRTRHVRPETTGTYNLGTHTQRWSKAYVDNVLSTNTNVCIGTCNSSGSWNTYGALYINSSGGYVTPSASGSLSLGSSSLKFHSAYFTNTVSQGSDIRLKRNINYFEDQDNVVRTMSEENNQITTDDIYNFFKDDIKIATYNMIPKGVDYKTVPASEDWGEETDTEVGFIAQDIYDTEIGKLFIEECEDGLLSYKTSSYQSLAVIALQKALKKIEVLEKEVAELKNR